MRISNLHIYNIANNSMRDASVAISKTQEELSSGRRLSSAADDPVAATRIQQLNNQLQGLDQYDKNITIAQNNLDTQENTLESITNLVQRMQEIAVQSGNTAVLSRGDYAALAAEVDTRLDELFNLVNTRNAGGDYIFSGFQGSTPAFSGDAANGFHYDGDEGQINIQISDTAKIPVSDSGKGLFANIQTGINTVRTFASPSNQSEPPATISLGQVVDQDQFDAFYPEDIMITFNADSDILPPGKNFTVTERSTGKIIEENHRFIVGETLNYKGVEVSVAGDPASGVSATEATRRFGTDAPLNFPQDFSVANGSIDIQVGNRLETIILDTNITNVNDLVSTLNDVGNGNAAKLANLNITVDTNGFQQAQGINFTVNGGSVATSSVTGLDTVDGTTAVDGARAKKGDQLVIESTDKQDILTTLARFSQVMKSYDGSDSANQAMQAIAASTITTLSFSQESVSTVVTQIGARVNTLDTTRETHLDTQLIGQRVLSDLQDTDYAEAATRLSTQTMILEAAQATFLRVSQLTLFERL